MNKRLDVLPSSEPLPRGIQARDQVLQRANSASLTINTTIYEQPQYHCFNGGKDSFVRGIDPNTACTSNYHIW